MSASAAKLAEKDSKRKEKEDSKKRKSIDKPSSAKRPRTPKASAHIIQELCRIAAFQAQLILFTKVDKTKKNQRWALSRNTFMAMKKGDCGSVHAVD